jgi:RNA polymerase sigma-70 factor (ECF subfamily)
MTNATIQSIDLVKNGGQQARTAGRTHDRHQLPAPSFAAVVDDIGDEIYRFAWQLTCNKPDADDLYQETLLKAFRAFPKLPADANYRAWFYRITSNTFISDRRKRARDNPLSEAHEQTLRADTPDNARTMDARDLLRDVEVFVTNLPPKQRVALVLRKYHGHGYDHIAATLNSSEVAARANVHEALRKLREQFADRLEA